MTFERVRTINVSHSVKYKGVCTKRNCLDPMRTNTLSVKKDINTLSDTVTKYLQLSDDMEVRCLRLWRREDQRGDIIGQHKVWLKIQGLQCLELPAGNRAHKRTV